MATYTKTVDPNGGADYASINAWEAGEQALYLPLDIAIADCKRTGATKDTTAVTISGWTAGVIPKIIVNAAHRHEGKWADQQSGGNYTYILESSVLTSGVLINIVSGFVCAGLLVANSAPANAAESAFRAPTASGDTLLVGCILRHTGGGRYVLRVDNVHTVTAQNCVVYGGSLGACVTGTSGSAVLVAHNCTAIGVTSGFLRSLGSITTVNCYANGTTAYSGTITKTTCASSDTTGSTGLQNIAYSTANFVNVTAGSEDLHLISGSALIATSTDLSATFTTDIDDDTRPASNQFGIGADFYVAAGGGGFLAAWAFASRQSGIIGGL